MSGFGNFVTPQFSQSYLEVILPKAIVSEISEKAVSDFSKSPNLCTAAELACITTPIEETTTEISNLPTENTVNDTLNQLLAGQEILSQQIQAAYERLTQQIGGLSQSGEETITSIDLEAQRRAELQAQIEALQAEMQNI